MASIAHWTGHEAKLLRQALRLSVRGFAARLGIGVRTITKWETLGADRTPNSYMQGVLDTALLQAAPEAKQLFEHLVRSRDLRQVAIFPADGPQEWDYETWSDDLGRIAACISRQDFKFAASLIDRWLRRFSIQGLDEKGQYLHARSLALLGDLQRDQGAIKGPISARQTYRKAHEVFQQLGIQRRAAQVELSLAVVDEMSGLLLPAAEKYRALADDERLSLRDRSRAKLWVGTALSKDGDHASAVSIMDATIQEFEELEEPDDWSVAHQKLALAHRGAGNIDSSLRYIGVALEHRPADSPMQRVRIDTAHAHILLSDPRTAENGVSILTKTAQVATRFELSHQLKSIRKILDEFDSQPTVAKRSIKK
ncbi:hypothetical protein D5S17_09500 [Pseudonocardiaceae bacterium YIM PH 21723]|nr:hypothetical protein D5S17_09500 [Pseudonocardiaceae bacterium YIM PH 21723]